MSSSTTLIAAGRPAQLDGAVAQRVLARRGLGVALDLMQRGLTHIDDRAAAALQLGDLRAVTHRARPPPTARAAAPTPTSRCCCTAGGSVSHTAAAAIVFSSVDNASCPAISASVFHAGCAVDRTPRDTSHALGQVVASPPATRALPTGAPPAPATADQTTPPARDRRSRRPADTSAASRRHRHATPAPPRRRRAARPAPRPAAPSPAADPQHEYCVAYSPGTGKTHLAIALGIRACLAGHRVAFKTATEWVAMLADAQRHGRLDDELDQLQRVPLADRRRSRLHPV